VLSRVRRKVTNYSGCMGVKSVPTTFTDGYAFARIPVSLQTPIYQEARGFAAHQNQLPNCLFQSQRPRHYAGRPLYLQLVQHGVFHPRREASDCVGCLEISLMSLTQLAMVVIGMCLPSLSCSAFVPDC
jgi:hypothetical protein